MIYLRESSGPREYPRLVQVWRSAVDATHHFLADTDRADIEANLETVYFPQVRLIIAEADGIAVGFAGTAEGELMMLFVDADARGQGIGGLLLDYVVADHNVRTVDVNEQNTRAVDFYLKKGFDVIGRSETDGEGRAYPLLHLALLDTAAKCRCESPSRGHGT